MRCVINAILREYGKPDAIHVELARSLKMSQEKRPAIGTIQRLVSMEAELDQPLSLAGAQIID